MNRREGICELTASEKNGRTVISDCYYTAPFKIMNPFLQGNKTSAMIMTASAGMLSGDDYRHRFVIKENADFTITGQGYTKIFNTKEDYCTSRIEIKIEEHAVFHYLPHPVIPFAGSDYRGEVTVKLTGSSTFVYMDILATGRAAREEIFQMKRYRSQFQVFVDNRLVFLDRMLLDPDRIDYRTPGFFGEYTHTGMMYLYRPGDMENLKDGIRSMDFSGKYGVTSAKEGLMIRALANAGDELENFFLKINQLV